MVHFFTNHFGFLGKSVMDAGMFSMVTVLVNNPINKFIHLRKALSCNKNGGTPVYFSNGRFSTLTLLQIPPPHWYFLPYNKNELLNPISFQLRHLTNPFWSGRWQKSIPKKNERKKNERNKKEVGKGR